MGLSMRSTTKKMDLMILLALAVIIVGLPLGIRAYDQHRGPGKLPPGAKIFTLTGQAQRGWRLGDIKAVDVLSLWGPGPLEKPVITVSRGDRVVLKLKSSDVVHGFSLKDLGVYITDGIQPGKVLYVSFTADKVGTFIFSCNAVCGDNHQNMQGALIVKV